MRAFKSRADKGRSGLFKETREQPPMPRNSAATVVRLDKDLALQSTRTIGKVAARQVPDRGGNPMLHHGSAAWRSDSLIDYIRNYLVDKMPLPDLDWVT